MRTRHFTSAATRALAVAVALSCAAAMSAPGVPESPGNDSTGIQVWRATPSPAQFVRQAAQNGMAQEQLSQLAQSQTAAPAIRRFAAQMITDHRKVNAELKSIAAAKGIDLPRELAPVHVSSLESLRAESAAGFNDAYIALTKREHLKNIALFEATTRAGFSDVELKAFASRTLPMLKEHLDSARAFLEPITGQGSARDVATRPAGSGGEATGAH